MKTSKTFYRVCDAAILLCIILVIGLVGAIENGAAMLFAIPAFLLIGCVFAIQAYSRKVRASSDIAESDSKPSIFGKRSIFRDLRTEPPTGKEVKAYDKYKLAWMLENGHTLEELIESLDECRENEPLNSTIGEVYQAWQFNGGFDGSLWPTFGDFLFSDDYSEFSDDDDETKKFRFYDIVDLKH